MRSPGTRPLAMILAGGLLSGCSALGGGGGGDGGSGSGSGVAGSNPPAFEGPAAVSSDSGTLTLRPEAEDPDSRDELSFRWSVQSGPSSMAAFGPAAGDGATTASFPLVGTYQVQVEATDLAGNRASHDMQVTITPAAGHDLRVKVADVVAGADAPLRSMPVDLVWSDQVLSRAETDLAGWAAFGDLADDPVRYRVVVPAN